MKKIKILIIEDEPMLREAYRYILDHKGYVVAVADDGLQGIEQLRVFEPQIILLDVLMPRLDGIGFLRRSRLKETFPEVKVIACTNLSDQLTAGQMLRYGADRQILKSDLSPAQLVLLVEELAASLQGE